VILDCYRLAKYFCRDPDDFLNKPLSSIQRHMKWITQLMAETQKPDDEEY